MSDLLRPPYNSIWFSAILFVALIATAFIAHRVARARGRDQFGRFSNAGAGLMRAHSRYAS